MNLAITPKEITILKKKGIDINEFQSIRRHWQAQLKDIRTNFTKNDK